MANLDIIRGRQVVLPLTNKSGGGLVEGDVVVVDTTTDDSFTTTTTTGNTAVIGVVAETIANNAAGRVVCGGYVPTLAVDAATARGDYLKTSTVAGDATPASSITDTGIFGVALSAVGGAGNVSAYILPIYTAGAPGLASDAYWGKNLVHNSPGQIVTDGAEPQWWDDVANATITDEDTAGEGIPDIHERVFKVVTIADDVYGYNTLTFADEELLDAGQTAVSFGCWVYCATGAKASIGIYGTNLGLQESSQAPATTWTWLTVENQTLNAADTSIQLRLIVDTDTAWFTMPMCTVGATAQPWKPRGVREVQLQRAIQVNANPTGDIAWADTDCTANADPLAIWIQVVAYAHDPGAARSVAITSVSHDDVFGADLPIVRCDNNIGNGYLHYHNGVVQCNDSQVIRYSFDEGDADNDAACVVFLMSYWMWE